MAQSLASLVVDLKVETSELRKGLDAANAKLSGFDAQFKKMSAGLKTFSQSVAVDLGKQLVVGLTQFVLKGADAADQMNKMAQSAGMSVESFSKLDYIAGLSGLSTQELGAAMSKLNKNLAEGAAGGREQAAIFDALGVKMKDASGKVRGTDAVLTDLAQVFSQFDDGASKSALAMEVFGKSGAALVPFLNQGAAGIERLKAEAERLGIVIGGETAAAAEQFNDNIEKIERSINAIAVRVAGQLAPALNKFTEEMLNSKTNTDALKESVDVLATGLKLLVSVAVVTFAAFEGVGGQIGRAAAIVASAATGDLAGVAELLEKPFESLTESAEKAFTRLKVIWAEADRSMTLPTLDLSVKRSADNALRHFKAMAKAPTEYESALKALTKVAVDYETKVASFGAGPLEELTYRLEKGDLAEQLKKIGDQAEAMKDRILEAAGALRKLELSKAKESAQFDLKQKTEERGRAAAARQPVQGVSLFGESPKDKQLTKGFDDANDALSAYAENMRLSDEFQAAAAYESAKGDIEAARGAQMLANQANAAGEQAQGAAEAFGRIGDQMRDLAVNTGKSFASKLGDEGEIALAAWQGAETGGIWGAFLAAILTLFSKFERFQEIVDYSQLSVNQALHDLKDGFSELVDGFKSLQSAIQPLKNIIHGVLNPVFKILGQLLDRVGQILTPILASIETSFAPIFGVLESFSGLFDSISGFKIIIPVISAVFNSVSLTLLGTFNGILLAWNWVLGVVHGIVKAFGGDTSGIESMVQQNQANIDDVQAKMVRIWNNITNPEANTKPVGFGTDIETPDLNSKLDVTSDKIKGLGDAAAKATEQLLNVPSGYKVAAAQFRATAPERSNAEMLADLKRARERESFLDHGNPFSPHGGG